MGYELHIIRRTNWDDEEAESNIALEEWLQYVATDAELNLTNGYESKFPGEEISWTDRPGFCLWTAHPDGGPYDAYWLDYRFGMISCKNPDDFTVMKMIEIATALDAKVQGDHGEYYDISYFDNKSLPTEALNQKSLPVNKPWWKFW